ncbi:YaaW family protein [Trichothermofontia sp.]
MDELRSALELATEDELRHLTHLLFCRRLNPLDYLQTPDPLHVQSLERDRWLTSLERRFRFLAADGLTVLQQKTDQVKYRQVLLRVCHYLKITYQESLSTPDLEAEIFLHLMHQAWPHLSPTEQDHLRLRVQRALAQMKPGQPLPARLQHDPIGLLLKGGSVLAVTSVLKPLLLRQLARHMTLQIATSQVAKQTLLRGGMTAVTQWHSRMLLQTAKQGVALAATRQVVLRSLFAWLGPVLWAWFLSDLGWRTIATNYGRIIPAIFSLAQIRLLRSEDLLQPGHWEIA